jgi:molybdopterin molybdotransferase
MTGAPLPEGTDAVVMLEDVHAGPDAVVIGAAVERGLNVRPRGEHLRAGQAALPAGRRLRSWDLGLATVAGLDTLAVFRPLRVGVLSTGDELLDPAQPLAASQQYDGNRPMLRAALMRRGFEVVDLGIVSDRADALDRTLRTAAALGLDAVLSSGGVAQGDADLVRRLPGLEFLPLALRPGRGLVGGHIEIAGRKLAYFGLPGNPVAAFLMYQLVVVPLLDRLGGATAEEPLIVRLPLATEARTRAGRVDWRRGRIEATPAGPRVALLALQGSSMLRSLSEADALVGIGPQPETLAGDLVDVIPLATLD